MTKQISLVRNLVVGTLIVWFSCLLGTCQSFSVKDTTASAASETTTTAVETNKNNVLILDHININHETGRHDWVKAFYGDFLGCAWDPRKIMNMEKEKGTLWANIGAHQFHLPEGKPDAQVLDGKVTLAFLSLKPFNVDGDRYKNAKNALSGSKFHVQRSHDKSNGDETLIVQDPWGSKIVLVEGNDTTDRDPRGKQPGNVSEGLGMKELTIHVPSRANLDGIGRWYETVLGGTVISSSSSSSSSSGGDVTVGDHQPPHVKIAMGPFQSLTFIPHPGTTVVSHVDLREEPPKQDSECSSDDDQSSQFLANYGPHISLYVLDLASTYQRASEVGSTYVNTRFSRQAFSLDQALDQCMFRSLDIVDPLEPESGVILRLEHEIRSVVKTDGTKYKSCPFDDITKL
mmetsp:Transcript_29865/g.72367  ORF Transcript_29865/g.72367 Transcript_29865/m.72367 type:complete len:402 (+) Transcript_29865:50-1255(+)